MATEMAAAAAATALSSPPPPVFHSSHACDARVPPPGWRRRGAPRFASLRRVLRPTPPSGLLVPAAPSALAYAWPAALSLLLAPPSVGAASSALSDRTELAGVHGAHGTRCKSAAPRSCGPRVTQR